MTDTAFRTGNAFPSGMRSW